MVKWLQFSFSIVNFLDYLSYKQTGFLLSELCIITISIINEEQCIS